MRRPAAAITVLTAIAFATADADAAPRCHGERATFVGTNGRDKIKYDSEAFAPHHPVLVLRGGDDLVDVDSSVPLTICAGPGGDALELLGGSPHASAPRKMLIDGGAGDDSLRASGSTDELLLPPMTLIGGPGEDLLRASNGRDLLRGGGGDDVVAGEYGDDRISGDGGADELYGNGDADVLRGGDGEDFLLGGGRSVTAGPEDRANGGHGRDRCGAEIVEDCERIVPDLESSTP